MEFLGSSDESIQLLTITNKDTDAVTRNVDSNLFIFWNTNQETILNIDGIEFKILPYQMVLLTEFHKIDISKINEMKMIKFNRKFYCIHEFNEKIGCRGILFFWASEIPIISLNEENITKFELLWTVFQAELKLKDDLQGEMLKMLLKRFLIMATRIYKEFHQMKDIEESKIDVIRNYFYFVETNYKTKHSVADYAILLNKPAKSITNLFAAHYNKSPLKVIQERIHIEAKRYLGFSDRSIKEIAYDLGFDDMQSFSRFFKNIEGVSPKEFKDASRKLA
ncbi:helix-turn-helix domain-containing protein [Flavobacterium sp.]|uniref:helix-turn-helix domain-containing protein n=1 Tax=Flavobacterium sp. TaxID=239 RepID=UPI00286DD8D9|nr:helix-turn-helix domain-containing protein [Flavobacterium sp.]